MIQGHYANVSLFFIGFFFNVCAGSSQLREGFSLAAVRRDYCLVMAPRLLTELAPRCRPRVLGHRGSLVVVHRLSCSMAYGIFLDQESNLCSLPWQADS